MKRITLFLLLMLLQSYSLAKSNKRPSNRIPRYYSNEFCSLRFNSNSIQFEKIEIHVNTSLVLEMIEKGFPLMLKYNDVTFMVSSYADKKILNIFNQETDKYFAIEIYKKSNSATVYESLYEESSKYDRINLEAGVGPIWEQCSDLKA